MNTPTIAYIGDVHVGNPQRMGGQLRGGINDRGRQVLGVYEAAIRAAFGAGATHIVVLGDLLDTMRPTPQIVAEVRRIHRIAKEYSGAIILLKGNHDSDSDAPGDNALAMLQEPYVEVVDTQRTVVIGDTSLHCVPFRAGVINDWLPESMTQFSMSSAHNHLVLHAGIRTATTAPWLLDSVGAVSEELLDLVCEKHGIDLVFAGDWHDHKRCGAAGQIWQMGAICPTGFNNLGIDEYGHVAITRKTVVTPLRVPGPRFIKRDFVDGSLRDVIGELPAGNTYYIEYTAKDEAGASEARLQGADLKYARALCDYAVVLAAKDTSAEVKQAAAEAAEVSGIPAAIQAYVAKEVPAALRAAVIARSLRYLGQ